MQKVLAIFGAIFLVLIFCGGAIFGVFVIVGTRLDMSSKAYVDESVPAIFSTWSKDEMMRRSSSGFRDKVTDAQLARLFDSLQSRLGAYQSYDGAKGDSNIGFTPGGRVITAAYVAKVAFEHGQTDVTIRLIQEDGSWKILLLNVNLQP